jgi:DNA polymerase (family 10)
MRFGVGTARGGWVEPRHVLNTRSISEVRAFLARKRSRPGL